MASWCALKAPLFPADERSVRVIARAPGSPSLEQRSDRLVHRPESSLNNNRGRQRTLQRPLPAPFGNPAWVLIVNAAIWSGPGGHAGNQPDRLGRRQKTRRARVVRAFPFPSSQFRCWADIMARGGAICSAVSLGRRLASAASRAAITIREAEPAARKRRITSRGSALFTSISLRSIAPPFKPRRDRALSAAVFSSPAAGPARRITTGAAWKARVPKKRCRK